MIQRLEYINILKEFKDKRVIKVVTGVRRCGKSTILKQYQHYLKQEGISDNHIISVDLEDGNYRHIDNANTLYDYIVGLLNENSKNYVFIDEVQIINDFQKAVDWLYVKENVDLYISGSNSNLLSGELATLLSGRYVEIKMLPLSFKEYVSAFSSNSNYQELFNNYLINSSFPGALEMDTEQSNKLYLDGIYNTVLIKDVISRTKISDVSMLKSIVIYLFDNIGNTTSSNKISNYMTSSNRKISVPTVETYLEALIDSYVIYKANRYDIKGKQYLSTGCKYYIVDIGLRYNLLGNNGRDMGHILENVVYLELIRRGYEVYIGKFTDKEVDFIAKKGNDVEYYQVSYSVMNEETLKRELSPLNSINDHNPKYLITMDYVPAISFDGIKQVNAIDWLLNN